MEYTYQRLLNVQKPSIRNTENSIIQFLLRPHETLEMKIPASVHSFSNRSFREERTHFGYEPNLKFKK